MQPITKGPFKIIEKPTDVTYKLIDPNKKNQPRNNFVPYYPKEYVPRELTQKFSFTSLNINEKLTENNKNTRKVPIIYHSDPIHIKNKPSKKITKKHCQKQKKNHSNANHRFIQISQKIITKFLSHNLSYKRK